ncbi:hypothetical protein [uncultured Kingella sp.]|uniref:hypothetical protein n=1 Tax=uncultured Kingella sp. TaxID=159270 RepID=UPI002599D7B8|nr:hypothetical protein [uncultured Kingella sp.]
MSNSFQAALPECGTSFQRQPEKPFNHIQPQRQPENPISGCFFISQTLREQIRKTRPHIALHHRCIVEKRGQLRRQKPKRV